jgi:uncharacterized protein YukE
MTNFNPLTLRELATDLEAELGRLERLAQETQRVWSEVQQDPARADIFYESLALKLHNFYTGCERIFRLISNDLNGGVPSGSDWHKRLLDRMAMDRDNRPAVLTVTTAQNLQEYLGFRHIVRNLYSFELDILRVEVLVQRYYSVWQGFDQDIRRFVQWLRDLADTM